MARRCVIGCTCPVAAAPSGLRRHAPHTYVARHGHAAAFATIVLAGRALECGDSGRHEVSPGDVIVHEGWERHLDEVASCGAQVLLLPLSPDHGLPARGKVNNPDEIARRAERSPDEAHSDLLTTFEAASAVPADWPELLAAAMRADRRLSITRWARTNGLHPSSVARGFRQVFGVSPAGFRVTYRAQLAARAIVRTRSPLAAIACECGFADQAHMTRSVVRLTGCSPSNLRRSAPRRVLT
jgi:AraC-like DNA-binding protein